MWWGQGREGGLGNTGVATLECRCFSVAGPALWNELPTPVKECQMPIVPVIQGQTKNSPLPPSLQRPCVVLATFEDFQLFYLLCFYNYFTMHFNAGFIVLCFVCPSTLVIRICIFLSYRITNLYLCCYFTNFIDN